MKSRSEEPKAVEFDTKKYYVGDIINIKREEIDFQTTKGFNPPTIEISEGNYIIRVGKNDVIKQLRLLASEADSLEFIDHKKAFEISINYLVSREKVAFDHIWSWAAEDAFQWDEVERQDDQRVVRYVLRDQICMLLESGRFQLIEDGKKQKVYYFQRVDSNNGNVKGVFSKSNQMIWICPPFEID
ncbi:hypothetical protein [Rufibacter hautae]|uniref:Uncharacterized protein n=1 Tax=Rufibacter hautae TaxID=2595005 RepID=A0A5B6TCT9_9BACT|nr:hypothetical protein [Rufibacter hautae]KAA3436834.1 hypothetical protein FOA19_20890 [Rufibacter hautae]